MSDVSWGSYVIKVSDYVLDDRGQIPGGESKDFYLATSSTWALGLTQSPIQWVAGTHFLGEKQTGVKLTTHLHLEPRFICNIYLHSALGVYGVVLN
jgi:hypothetical protein